MKSVALLLRSKIAVTGMPRHRLTGCLPESRILTSIPSSPVIKVLLSLAETLVRDGVVRDALEFYKELANQASSLIAGTSDPASPKVKVYQVCSAGVRRLALAMALSPEGVQLSKDELLHIIILIASPAHSLQSHLAMVARTLRMLERRAPRELLLGSSRAAEARAHLIRLETDPDSGVPPHHIASGDLREHP